MIKTVVICSGGLDSVSMALIHKDEELTLMTFCYGQKAKKELDVVEWLANKYNFNFEKFDMSNFSVIFGKKNQLTNDNVEVECEYKPSIVVPLRNGFFLQTAINYAYSYEFDKILLGSHMDDCVKQKETDDYAFPDCTPNYFHNMEVAAASGTLKSDKHVSIISASTLGLHKIDLIRRAYDIDKEALFKTWSCYKNGEKQCGVCDSCRNRKKAFELAGIKDETEYLA